MKGEQGAGSYTKARYPPGREIDHNCGRPPNSLTVNQPLRSAIFRWRRGRQDLVDSGSQKLAQTLMRTASGTRIFNLQQSINPAIDYNQVNAT